MQVLGDVVDQVAPALARAMVPTLAKDDQLGRIVSSLDLDGFAVLIDPTAEALAAMATRAGVSALARLRAAVPEVPKDVELPNEAVVAFAQRRAAELVGKRKLADGTIVDNPDAAYAITDGTRELLRGTITQALDEAWTHEELRDHLAESYAFSKDRAELIARTELGRALVEGNLAAWRASGVVEGKRSILGSEHDDDDVCDGNAAAGVIPLADAFPSGDDTPPYHPRCVCDLTVELADEAVADG